MKHRFFISAIAVNLLIPPVLAGTSLSVSTENLALSIKGLTLHGLASGQSRVITITNIGKVAATGLSINYPTWPSGTFVDTFASTCNQGGTLAAGSSCTIMITPGSIATSGSNNMACTTGIAPTSGVISVAAKNTNQLSTNVVVLGYGCIYQEGYIKDIFML